MKEDVRMKNRKIIAAFLLAIIAGCMFFSTPAMAADTDVAGAVTSAYNSYVQPQVKSMVNGVVFPLLAIILGIAMVVRLCMSIYAYKHNGNQFEWHMIFGLFCALIVALTAKLWIWNIIR
jgi:FtsH-binding integral membrane protein